MNEIDREWLTDMPEHAREAIGLLEACGAAELERDRRTLLAVSHAVLIIGEAAARVSPRTRSELPDVPWSNVIGMRHRLVHGYRGRRTQILVDTVREHMPRLINSLEVALGDTSQ